MKTPRKPKPGKTKAAKAVRAKMRNTFHHVSISEADLVCLWAAVVLREPEPLTRKLKKILKPTALNLLAKGAK